MRRYAVDSSGTSGVKLLMVAVLQGSHSIARTADRLVFVLLSATVIMQFVGMHVSFVFSNLRARAAVGLRAC
jgi:uncharacterized membrane protein